MKKKPSDAPPIKTVMLCKPITCVAAAHGFLDKKSHLIKLTLTRCTVCDVGPGSSCHEAARDFPGKEQCSNAHTTQETRARKSQVTQSPPTHLKDNQPCRPPKEAPFLSQNKHSRLLIQPQCFPKTCPKQSKSQ